MIARPLSCVLALFLVCLAGCGSGNEEAKNLQGTWEVVSPDGLAGSYVRVLIQSDKISFENKGGGKDTFNFKLNPSPRPKHIDLMFLPGPPPSGLYAKGIYELDGDSLKLCYGLADRPGAFEDVGAKLLHLKRHKGGEGTVVATQVKSKQMWSGRVGDPALMKVHTGAPVTSKKDFEKIWRAWRNDDEVPAIDFAIDMMLTAVSDKGECKEVTLSVKGGDAKVKMALAAEPVSKGFTYTIAVFGREGIKTVNGLPIQK